MAQTTDRVSAIAANLIGITARDVIKAATKMDDSGQALERLVKDIRALAASALRQDETLGQRIKRKVFGL